MTDILLSSLAFVAVAKGSMNSVGRKQRRRISRPPSRRQHVSSSNVSSSSSASTSSAIAQSQAKQAEQKQRMQILRTHSSSGSSGISSDNSTSYSYCNSNSSNSNKHNSHIKTVLQPTMVNTNGSKFSYNGNNVGVNNKTNTAKLSDDTDQEQEPERAMEQDNFEEDGDSGYEFALEPNSQSLHIFEQQHHSQTTHNDGLLSIALKTIKLVQRNKLLQKRLAQLQLETSEFIASVLANPENRHFREKSTPNKVCNVLLRH